VLGSVLTNKQTYEMNPKETHETQRQINDLLAEDMIERMVNPYAVHTLLVPKRMGI